jgi:putative FmdB family regulatory protein
MPIYTFNCKCGNLFDKFYFYVINKKTEICPKCKKKANKIPSSELSFDFKGDGTFKKGFDGYERNKM